MLIPVFGSCPSTLNLSKEQLKILRLILGELGQAGLEWRSIGSTDYPTEYPLREVYTLARHCSGGVILGFAQFETRSGIWKKGTSRERKQNKQISFPTPWNHIESGILFALGVPLLIFRNEHIIEGVFDKGVTDLFVHEFPKSKIEKKSIRPVIQKFSLKVREHYYKA